MTTAWKQKDDAVGKSMCIRTAQLVHDGYVKTTTESLRIDVVTQVFPSTDMFAVVSLSPPFWEHYLYDYREMIRG